MLHLFFSPSPSLQRKTDIIKPKTHITMVTAVPACIVPTRQAADSGTKALGWSFREEKNFIDTEAK